MSLEYIELQRRACIEYLIQLHRRGAISNVSLWKGIRAFSAVPQASPPVKTG